MGTMPRNRQHKEERGTVSTSSKRRFTLGLSLSQHGAGSITACDFQTSTHDQSQGAVLRPAPMLSLSVGWLRPAPMLSLGGVLRLAPMLSLSVGCSDPCSMVETKGQEDTEDFDDTKKKS